MLRKKLKIGMTKIKAAKKKIEQRCNKNEGCQEKKLKIGMTKIKVAEEKN